MQDLVSIHIRKQALKFSAAHMTVFPDGHKENLHGHNYEVELRVRMKKVPIQEMISFGVFSAIMKDLCAAWDEKVLLPKHCPFLKINKETAEEVDFTVCKKRYVLPADEIVWIPKDNATSEALAETFCKRFVERAKKEISLAAIESFAIRVDEITGQGCWFEWRNPEWT